MASYPPGVGLANLAIGPVIDMFGDKATLTVTVQPNFTNGVKHITHTESGYSVADSSKVFYSDSTTGVATMQVPFTDETGWQDPSGRVIDVSSKPGWSYSLKVSASMGRTPLGSWTKVVQPLKSQTGTIDVDLVGDGNVLQGELAPSSIVVSIGGLTGIVTKTQLENLGVGATGNLQIGTVTSGDTAAASVTTDADGNKLLNLTLVAGAQGPQGPMGSGLAITGTVATRTDLDALTPAHEDAYVTNDTGLLYIYDSTTGWSDGIPFQGDPGADSTITVGTTTTGAAGTSAAVVNSGTASAATLDFTIPQGLKGDPGDPGAAATVAAGTTTTGTAGSSASVVNSGSTSAAVFDFTIPKGADGVGIPTGGLTGQVLTKADGTDYNTVWQTSAEGVTDHGLLTGLADDDHTQYALADGSRGAFAPTSHTHAYSDLPTLPELSATDDLDTFTTSGEWHQSQNADTDLVRNYPVAEAGHLKVRNLGGFTYQWYTTYANSARQFWREKYNPGAWTAWHEVSKVGHSHAIDDVTNLQTTLDGKAAAAAGVPIGGAAGQVLAKNTITDNDVTWVDQTAGVTDHGGLTGLSDDDHTQYALADGTRGDFLPSVGGELTGRVDFPATSFDIFNPPIRFTDHNVTNDESSKGNILEWGGMMTPGTVYPYGVATQTYKDNNAATFTVPGTDGVPTYKKWGWMLTHYNSPLSTGEAVHQHLNLETVKADWQTVVTRLQIGFGEDVTLVSFPNSNVKIFNDSYLQIGTDTDGAHIRHDTAAARMIVEGTTAWKWEAAAEYWSAAPGGLMLIGAVDGESIYRFVSNTSGRMEWGSGSASRDTNLYRAAADTLKTDDKFVAGGGLDANNAPVIGVPTPTADSHAAPKGYVDTGLNAKETKSWGPGTQAEYDALGTYDANTTYYVTG